MANRAPQIVATKADRKRVTEWMISEAESSNTVKNIATKAIVHFPGVFRQQKHNTRIAKARHWWITRD